MTRLARYTALALAALLWQAMLPGSATAQAQRRGADRPRPQPGIAVPRGPVRPHPVHVVPSPVFRGSIFIGGYFYDPFYGPYPWWNRAAYPYWYMPVFDLQANVRIKLAPKELRRETAVYVDGFYAGNVDEFDGAFQSLPLSPGGHVLTLYRDGYRTIRHNLYLSRGSNYTLRETMVMLPPGQHSELPVVAPPLPLPPEGTYRTPGSPPWVPPTARPDAIVPTAEGFSTLDLFVQPDNAEVLIDGERWTSNEDGHYVLQLPAGPHRIEIRQRGFRTYATEFECREGETIPLNVSLLAMTT